MKKIAIILTSICLSCSTSKITNSDNYGYYYGQSEGLWKWQTFKYYIALNEDGSFNYKSILFEAKPSCLGEWKKKGNKIQAKCYEEDDVTEVLSSGYMGGKEIEITLINNNAIRLNNVLFRKKPKPDLDIIFQNYFRIIEIELELGMDKLLKYPFLVEQIKVNDSSSGYVNKYYGKTVNLLENITKIEAPKEYRALTLVSVVNKEMLNRWKAWYKSNKHKIHWNKRKNIPTL